MRTLALLRVVRGGIVNFRLKTGRTASMPRPPGSPAAFFRRHRSRPTGNAAIRHASGIALVLEEEREVVVDDLA